MQHQVSQLTKHAAQRLKEMKDIGYFASMIRYINPHVYHQLEMEKCFTEAKEKRAIKAQAFATTKKRSTLFQDQHNQDKSSLLPDLNTPSDQRSYYTGHNKSRAKGSYIGRGSHFEATLTGTKDGKKQDGHRDMDLVFTWKIRAQYKYVWHNE
eukprot:11410948-Ditylum_brightwellii.AAC.2